MIGEIIRDYAQNVTLLRYATGALDHGRNTPGSTTTSTISFAFVPMTDKELSLLPEGMRARGAERAFSETELRTHPIPDDVTCNGVTFEVLSSKPWVHGAFWECLLVRKAGQ